MAFVAPGSTIANLFIIKSPWKTKVETLCADATLRSSRTTILHPSAHGLSILSGARTETSKAGRCLTRMRPPRRAPRAARHIARDVEVALIRVGQLIDLMQQRQELGALD